MVETNNIQINKDYYTFLDSLFSTNIHTVDDLLIKLKDYGYALLPYYLIPTPHRASIDLNHEKFVFAVKRTRFVITKPHKDRYNFNLMIGMDYHAKNSRKIPIYLYKQLIDTKKLDWPASHRNFKAKKDTVSFPACLDIEERKKWRADHVRYLKGKQPTEFYLKHLQAIKDMNPKFRFD